MRKGYKYIEELGYKIPEEWEVIKFETICKKIKSGGTPLTNKQEYYNGNIPFVKIEDVTKARKYINITISTISKAGQDNSNSWLVPQKSLLLAIYGSLGVPSINNIEVTTNQAILGIILKQEVADTEFFFYLFSKLDLKKYAKQSTQANLTAKIIKELVVSLPSLKEQQKHSHNSFNSRFSYRKFKSAD